MNIQDFTLEELRNAERAVKRAIDRAQTGAGEQKARKLLLTIRRDIRARLTSG